MRRGRSQNLEHSSSSSEDEGDDSKHDLELHDWITGPVWRNKRSKVVHKHLSLQLISFVAGQLMLTDGCSTMFARCSVCFRGEIISSVDGLAEALQFVRSKRARTVT